MSEHDYLITVSNQYLQRTEYVRDPLIIESRALVVNLRDYLIKLEAEQSLLRNQVSSAEVRIREEILRSLLKK